MIVFVPSGSGQSSYILHETGYREYSGAGTGSLSIKSFFGGQAHYVVGRNRYRVDDHRHLILNHGQSYAIHITAERPVESFCVFFAEGFAEDVRRALTQPQRLDDLTPSGEPLNFFEKTYPDDPLLTPAILRLRAGVASGRVSPGWLEEHLHLLMQRLLHVHYKVYREVELLPAARRATREELYRRLHYARDYALAQLDRPLTLAELAEVACLSPNHLLRSFKQTFGQTPHQFIVSKRLEEAQRLLRHSDTSITAICYAVGFESPGSFSWLFRRRFGLSPSEFRQQSR